MSLHSACSYEEIHGLRELFQSFDRNGDGHITLDELREGLARSSKLADSEVEQVGGVCVCGCVGGVCLWVGGWCFWGLARSPKLADIEVEQVCSAWVHLDGWVAALV